MNISLDSYSAESDVFYMEQTSTEGSPIRNNTPAILNSTEISGAMETEVITISSVASPEPRIVTLDSDSNDPTVHYGFGHQQPIVPPSLKDLNLPPNPFNVLPTMAVILVHDEYSPQSPEPTILFQSQRLRGTSVLLKGGTQRINTTDNDTFNTDDEPRRVYWDISSSDTFDFNEPRNVSVASSPSSTPPSPSRQKRRLSMGMSFPQKMGSVAAHLRGMRPTLTARKATQCLEETQTLTKLSI